MTCHKIGHSEATCFVRAKKQESRSDEEKNQDGSKKESHDIIIIQNDEMDPVLSPERTSDGQSMPKIARPIGPVRIKNLLNPGRVPSIPKMRVGRKKTTRQAKKDVLQKVSKDNVAVALSNTPCGMKFGQILPGDAIEAKKELMSMLRNITTRTVRAVNVATETCNYVPIEVQEDAACRALCLTSVTFYGTDTWALLDSGASPNILS